MLASDRVLGPRWSPKELRTFYILLKAIGRQWERLEERLPLRSNAMIRALYEMHRGYLSLPEASVEGFCTIMMDHYKNMDELLDKRKADAVEGSGGSGGGVDGVHTPRANVETSSACGALPVADEQDEPMPDTPVQLDTRTRKKRKLDMFLARDGREPMGVDAPMTNADDDTDTYAKCNSPHVKKTAFAKSPVVRRREWLRGPHGVHEETLRAKKFGLPWFYWFYSFVDVDFFAHNEFVECLERMGLGKITKAARPVWGSVRASMGRPRRLSALFLAQEKEKLNNYRRVKRQTEITPELSSGWPYRSPAVLSNGLAVLASLSRPPRFVVGMIENFSLRDGVCKVRLESNGSRVCNLDAVMILHDDRDTISTPLAPGGSASCAAVTSSADAHVTVSPPPENQQDKLTTILLVKDLLMRKELIINALTKMNEQARILRHEPPPGARDPPPIPAPDSPGDQTVFQRQYAWLVVNLDVTNRYLRAALLRLQDVSDSVKTGSTLETSIVGNGESAPLRSTAAPEAAPMPLAQTLPGSENSAMLTLEHMRWAVNFLTLTRKKSSELVAGVTDAAKVAVTTEGSGKFSATTEDDADPQSTPLPETTELIANCVSLMSVLRRGSSPDVPPLITQKLMERMFELLEPRFEGNMDLYAELRSAAEGIAALQQQQQQRLQQPAAQLR